MSDVSDKMIDNFKYMSIETLEDIAKGKSDDYEPEAIKVAKKILKERIESTHTINSSKDKGTEPKESKSDVDVEVIHTDNTNSTNQDVVVTDIRMPFISMVIFMVKWVIASIPAMIILFLIGLLVTGIFGVGVISLFK